MHYVPMLVGGECWVVGRWWLWMFPGKKTGTNGDRKARSDWYTLTNLFCLLRLKRLGSCHRAQLYHFFSHGMEDCRWMYATSSFLQATSRVQTSLQRSQALHSGEQWTVVAEILFWSLNGYVNYEHYEFGVVVSCCGVCRWRTIQATTS